MKAFVRDRYGSPDVLELRDVEPPTMPDDAVLVRVRATSVNALDWHTLRGKPYLARLDEGIRRPKTAILGTDVAGTVEAVGANVGDLQPGDAVFGSRTGAFAELVAGRNLVPMPTTLTFEEAAAVPVAGQTALQGLRDRGALQAGERVLVDGAGGGVGTFAVQIAKALGAGSVTAVTHAASVDMVRGLGADEVLDRAAGDITRRRERYDLVLDITGTRRLADLRRLLAPGGRIVLVAPQPGQWIGPIVRVVGAELSSRLRRPRAIPFLSQVSPDDLHVLRGLIDEGHVRPVVERTYRFEDLPDAIRHVEAGRARGKVVVTVSQGSA